MSPLPDDLRNPAAIGKFQILATREAVAILERVDARLARLEAAALPPTDGPKPLTDSPQTKRS